MAIARRAPIATHPLADALFALVLALPACSLDSRQLQVSDGANAEGAVEPWSAPRFRSAAKPVPGRSVAEDPALSGGELDAADQHGPPADAAADSEPPDAAADAGPGVEAGAEPAACHGLEVNAGWVDDMSNCLEIQGRVWASGDNGDGTLAEWLAQDDVSPVCMLAPSAGELPTTLGFNLNQDSAAAQPLDYDANIHDVVGFRVTVTISAQSGSPFPFVGVLSDNGAFCMRLPGLGVHDFRFTDLTRQCWEMTGGPSPDAEHIRAVVFIDIDGWNQDAIATCVEVAALVEPRSD